MICHYCQREAAAKCVSCGLAICPDHGNRYCQVCSGAVFSREDHRFQREEKGYLQCPPKPRMETIYLDDDGPPECCKCQAFAKRVCQNCHNLFCREHIGKDDWCPDCIKASRIGTWLAVGMVASMAGLSLLSLFLGR
jgi:hypothetical protein